MSSPLGRPLLIVNQQAGGRKVDAVVRRLQAALAGHGVDYDLSTTGGPGHASHMARERLEEGGRFLVAVGGDGTVHEVVNGMFVDGRTIVPQPVLGVVAAGSGCDFVRTFGLPTAPAEAAARLAGAETRALDLARIDYVDAHGSSGTRYFANIAEAGLGGATAARAAGLPRLLGPSRYFFAFWATLPSYQPGTMRIEVDGVVAHEGRTVNVVVANGRFFGGGMHISPRSDPGDGTLELLVFTGRKTDSFTMLPKVYRGRHVPHPSIVELRGRCIRLESEQPFTIEADGEILGTTPATVEVLPSPIRLKV
ncbi:MAG: diacylglycerol kinase family lipid kinase [Actinobacteria bacterium]|nr:diacylglycerol kinase family lipid kinase [Actinomycetota bacterium]